MPSLYFTREEVAAAAGVDPWKRYTDFQNEINPDDIAATKDAYLRAADQATSVQDLATQATQISQQAGGMDGAPVVDGGSRDAETSQAMQDGGANIGAVVEQLVQAMNTAVQTHDDVRALIYAGGTGLETKYADHLQAAVDEYNAWAQSMQGQPLVPGTAEAMAESIRQTHIQNAAASASATDTAMTLEVEMYRQALMAQANELQNLGFEPSEGPFQAFTTDEMATWAAEGLNQELARENPDEQIVEMYTEGLQSIIGGVYGDPHAPDNVADRGMTPQESGYLGSFYGALSADSLAKLGSMEDAAGFAQSSVANGIDMLMNPDIGGIDTQGTGGRGQVPASIAEYLYGYGDKVTDQASVDRYNGFGELMESATLTPGDAFAESLGMSALDVQEAVDQANLVSAAASYDPETASSEPLELTGSSDVLSHASGNPAASLGLLTDPGVRDRMLGANWQDSQGIADVITSGTRPAEDGTMTAEQEAVADGVLGYYADNPDDLIHDWETSSVPLAIDYDNVPLQGAVAETALNRMDALVGYGDALPSEDVYGVFSLMGAADPSVNEYFKAGIGAEQYDLANDVYSGNVDAAARQGVLENIGDLTQYVNWGEADAVQHYAGDQDKQDKLTQDQAIASVGAAATIGGLFGGPVGAAAGAVAGAGWSVATPAFSEYEAQAPKDLADYQAGEVPLNNQLMEYALLSAAADASNANGAAITLPDVAADPTVSEALAAAHAVDDDANTLLGQLAAQDDSIRDDIDAVQTGSNNITEFTPDHPFAAERRAEAAEAAEAAERAARNGR